MKGLKLSLVIMAAALLTIGLGGVAYAFHDGGVAECGGCHAMHTANQNNNFLLIGYDASSTCLSCHEAAANSGPSSFHVSTPSGEVTAGLSPKQRTPGGDFAWLKKTYLLSSSSSGTTNELGETHGHNIVAFDKGYAASTLHTTAPGSAGAFVSSQLGCQSCHDPHGRGRQQSDGTFMAPAAGVSGPPILGSGSYASQGLPPAGLAIGLYRILAYPGYTRASGVTWGAWPIAVAPSTYNQTEATNQVRVAYGSDGNNTWGRWCGTCHNDMTGHGSVTHVHPVDTALGGGSTNLANIYNQYVKSGDMSGSATTSFTSLVPFAEKTGTRLTLAGHAGNTNAFLNGPGNNDEVMCFSCHRGHASAFPSALRWNGEYEMLTINGNYPGTDSPTPNTRAARSRLMAEYQAGYYDRPASVFATYQRSLCNKCHAMD